MASFKTIDDLEVFRAAEELADAVWPIVMSWEAFARLTIGGQLVRAADSVGANLAEGHASGSFVEFRRFAGYSRRSLAEVRFFLRRAHARNLLNQDQTHDLQAKLNLLRPRLGQFVKYLNRRAALSKQKPPRINPSTDQRINPSHP
ncbi:MAG TPA: four helix bundle protein [Tepidisphaeraceae bacterium]|jgi:four helix bundle protein